MVVNTNELPSTNTLRLLLLALKGCSIHIEDRMTVFPDRRTPIQTKQRRNPYYRDPKNGTPDSGKLHIQDDYGHLLPSFICCMYRKHFSRRDGNNLFCCSGFSYRKPSRFPSNPLVIRVPFFLLFSFNKEIPAQKRQKGTTPQNLQS